MDLVPFGIKLFIYNLFLSETQFMETSNKHIIAVFLGAFRRSLTQVHSYSSWSLLHKTFTGEKTLVKSKNSG